MRLIEFFLFEKNNKITNKSTYLLHFLVAHVRTHGCKTITYESTFSIRLIIRLLYVQITLQPGWKQFANTRYTRTVLFEIRITTGYTCTDG